MRDNRTAIRSLKILLLGLLLMTLAACAANPSLSTPDQPPEIVDIQVTSSPPGPGIPTLEPYVFSTSEPGYVTLRGRLIVLDPRSILPAPDDAIYLVPLDADVPISTIPLFEEGDDITQVDVDERTGEFVFVNVSPGRYAVVAITISGTQFPTRKMDGGNLAIFDVTETDMDNTMELGDLTLP